MRCNLLSVAALLAACCLGTVHATVDLSTLPTLEPRADVDNQTNQSSTFFFYDHYPDANFTFTVRHVQQNGDIFFRILSPDAFSWVAVGFGSQMRGSLMFVVYPNTNGKDFVLSPRVGTGHVEPEWEPRVKMETIVPPAGDPFPNGIRDGTWHISGVCRNCTDSLGYGSGVDMPDMTNAKEQMIYAFGPSGLDPDSNALDAPLRRHAAYGHFDIDMDAATVTSNDDAVVASVTVPPVGTDIVKPEGNFQDDDEHSSALHATLMCFAFLVMFPLGVVAARVLERVKLHAAVQGIGLAVVLAGMGVGLDVSKYYNRSKHISNGHQIFGLVIVGLLVVQWAAGFLHHRHFVKHGTPMRGGIVIRFHQIMGPLVMAFGVVNGAFGFRFALTKWNVVYVPVVIAIILLLFGMVFFKYYMAKKRGQTKSSHVEGLGASAGYAQPPAYSGSGETPYSGPGPYGPPPEAYQGVPMVSQPYSNAAWDRSDIALQSMEPERPKQMV